MTDINIETLFTTGFREKPVVVEGWPAGLIAREVGALTRIQWMQGTSEQGLTSSQRMAHLIALTVLRPDGQPLFAVEQRDRIANLPDAVLKDLVTVVAEVNGLTVSQGEKAQEDFDKAPN